MKKIVRDNKGIALITVVIGVMFCLLLTSTMLRVSLLGLQSRAINNQSADTYYDSESVIDSLRMSLQNKAALAWATASNKADPSAYIAKVYKEITGADCPSSGPVTPPNKTKTIENMGAEIIDGGEIQDFDAIVPIYNDKNQVEGFTIENVSIKYVNPANGMVSYLKTNVTVSAPLYKEDSNYPLASYSMFAGSGAEIFNAQQLSQGAYGDPNEFGFLEQRGNVYFGYKKSDAQGKVTKLALEINSRETMILSGDNVTINGNVVVTKYSNLEITGKTVQIRGKIYLGVGCHLIIGEDTRLDCQDIVFCDSDAAATSGSGGKSVGGATYTQVPLSVDPFNDSGDPYYAYKYRTYPGNKVGYGSIGTDTNTNNPNYGTFAWMAKNGYLPYVCGNDYSMSQGIVFVKKADYDSTKHAYSKAYTAVVDGGTVYAKGTMDEQGHVVPEGPMRVYFDSTLTPKLRQKATFSDGHTKSKYEYDQFFAEIVDIECWEKFIASGSAINDNIDGSYVNIGEYIPSNQEDTENKGYKAKKNDKGKYESFGTYSGGQASKTATYLGYTFKIYLSKLTEDPKNFGTTDRILGLFMKGVQINVDSLTSEYTALIISEESVKYKKDQGYCFGESLLHIDTDSDKKNLKEFLEEKVGPLYNCGTPSDATSYCIFNNLFNGGMARFYEGDDGNSGAEKKVDVEYNSKMDLIDVDNYDKK